MLHTSIICEDWEESLIFLSVKRWWEYIYLLNKYTKLNYKHWENKMFGKQETGSFFFVFLPVPGLLNCLKVVESTSTFGQMGMKFKCSFFLTSSQKFGTQKIHSHPFQIYLSNQHLWILDYLWLRIPDQVVPNIISLSIKFIKHLLTLLSPGQALCWVLQKQWWRYRFLFPSSL